MSSSSVPRSGRATVSRAAVLCCLLWATATGARLAPEAIHDDWHDVAPAVTSKVIAGPDPEEVTAAARARELQREVSAWLEEELALGGVSEVPNIEFVPDDRLSEYRHHEVAAGRAGASDADVLAVYDDDARTIYLPESWSPDRSVGGSILVHETMHHIQNLTGETFACPEARETAAFDAQERWLNRFGDSLEGAFGIDPFTVIARSMCGW